MNYNSFLKNSEFIQKVQKEFDNDLHETTKQYENRFQRITQEFETKERQLQEVLLANKQLRILQKEAKANLTNDLGLVINSSSEIRDNSLMYLNDDTDASVQKECLQKMKFLLL